MKNSISNVLLFSLIGFFPIFCFQQLLIPRAECVEFLKNGSSPSLFYIFVLINVFFVMGFYKASIKEHLKNILFLLFICFFVFLLNDFFELVSEEIDIHYVLHSVYIYSALAFFTSLFKLKDILRKNNVNFETKVTGKCKCDENPNFCKVSKPKFSRLLNSFKFIISSYLVLVLFFFIFVFNDYLPVKEMNVIAKLYFIALLYFVLKFFFVYYVMSSTKVIKSFIKNIIPMFLSNPFEFLYYFMDTLIFNNFSLQEFPVIIAFIPINCAITLYPYFLVCYFVRKLKLLSKNKAWKFWAGKTIKIFTSFLGLIGPFAFVYTPFWFYGIDFENEYYMCLLFVPYFGILKQVIAAIYLKNLRLIPSNKKSIDTFIFSNSLKNDIKLYFIFYVLFILFSNMKG